MSVYREHIVKPLTRSSGWRKVRKRHLLLNPECEVCGKRKGLEVHHKFPFHLDPHMELDPTNLMTLCRRHHFAIGHLEYWRSYNPLVDTIVAYFKKLLKGRP